MKLDTTRFSGIFQVPAFFNAGVIGAGGIGAGTILALAKMGFRTLMVWDDDVVDGVNISTQFHKISDIGKHKVESIADAAYAYAGAAVYGYQERVTPETVFEEPLDILVSAVDSIAARQEIWQAVRANSVKVGWYLDARMAALEFQMYAVNLRDARGARSYEEQLMSMSDGDVVDLPCTQKATTFLTSLAAGLIGAEVKHILVGEAVSRFVVMNVDTLFTHTRKL